MRKTVVAGLGAFALALSLAACSSDSGTQSGSGEAQTTEQACELVYSGMQSLSEELEEVSDQQSGEDISAMVTAANTSLDKLSAEITNTKVKEVWEPIAELQRKGLQAAADEDEETLMAAYLEMSEKYEAFTAVCPDSSETSETQS